MHLDRLRPGELAAAGAAVLLAVAMFLPWYGGAGTVAPTSAPPDTGLNAWEAFAVVDVVLAITIAAALVAALLAATQTSVALPVAGGVFVSVLGALATLLVAFRLLDEPTVDPYTSIMPAAYGGLLLCATIAAGAWLSMRDEGATAEGPWATDDVPVEPPPAPRPDAAGRPEARD